MLRSNLEAYSIMDKWSVNSDFSNKANDDADLFYSRSSLEETERKQWILLLRTATCFSSGFEIVMRCTAKLKLRKCLVPKLEF